MSDVERKRDAFLSTTPPEVKCRIAKALLYGGEEAAGIVLERYLGSEEHRRDVAQWAEAQCRSTRMEQVIVVLTVLLVVGIGLWILGGR